MEITINSDSLGPKAKQALSMGWGIHAFNLAAFDTSARKKLREAKLLRRARCSWGTSDPLRHA